MKRIAVLLIFCLLLAGCGTETSGPAEGAEILQPTPEEQTAAPEETVTDPPEDKTGVFDLERGVVLLNSGYEMPLLGIGCFRLSQSQAENSVYWALRDGYRLIDTARIYGNEEGVGRGIKKAIDEGICTREEIFVTTKMWTSDFDDGDAAVDASLRRGEGRHFMSRVRK